MSKTVLLIDDDEIIRMTTEEILHELGYTVMSSDSGDHGLEVFRDKYGTIDIILLDLTMPGRSAVEIFRDMKLVDPDVRVLVSSGNSFDPKVEKLKALGTRGFLQKPFTIMDLDQIIKDNAK